MSTAEYSGLVMNYFRIGSSDIYAGAADHNFILTVWRATVQLIQWYNSLTPAENKTPKPNNLNNKIKEQENGKS